MAWPIERLKAACQPIQDTPGGRIKRLVGHLRTPLGRIDVSVHKPDSLRPTVHVGAVASLTVEQADRLLTLIRAVEPYPRPAGRTEPGEPVSYEIGGEG